MKYFKPLIQLLVGSLAAILAAKVQAGTQAQNANGLVQSVFVLPANSAEGRDPFFPESTRVMESAAAATASQNHSVEITSLKVPGISGTPGHYLAIINTHTFAVGDEEDLKIPGGGLAHIRCLSIQPDAVMVEINGQVHRLIVEDQ